MHASHSFFLAQACQGTARIEVPGQLPTQSSILSLCAVRLDQGMSLMVLTMGSPYDSYTILMSG